MADIFQEVDEDVRRDRALEFWRKYGKWATGAAVAVVLGIAGYNGWKRYDVSQREGASVRLEATVNELRTDKPKALSGLEGMGSDAPAPYGALARMRAAQARAEAGERDAAAGQYGMAAGALSPPEMRDMALLLALMQRFDTAPPEELRAALEPLTAADRPLRIPAQELMASLALRTGDVAKAREIFTALSTDIASPPGTRTRAVDMLAILPGEKK